MTYYTLEWDATDTSLDWASRDGFILWSMRYRRVIGADWGFVVKERAIWDSEYTDISDCNLKKLRKVKINRRKIK